MTAVSNLFRTTIAGAGSQSDRRRWIALGVLCLGQLMMVLDSTIVNVALPSIQHELHFTQSSLTWVIDGYLITFGGLLLLAGRLGDLVGRKRVFLTGLVLFTGASVLCGIATSQGMLIAFRLLQGAGGAVASSVIRRSTSYSPASTRASVACASSVVISVRKPRPPRLIPRMGVSRSPTRRAMLSKVPSPPSTTIRSAFAASCSRSVASAPSCAATSGSARVARCRPRSHIASSCAIAIARGRSRRTTIPTVFSGCLVAGLTRLTLERMAPGAAPQRAGRPRVIVRQIR